MVAHILGSLLLSAVFLVAGALKLSNRAGTAKNLTEFGVPQGLAGLGALVLPLAEIAVALALWLGSTAKWAAAGALALLLLFIVAISWNLIQGKKPECRCFGHVGAKPVGPSTLVRNGVLAAVAAFLLVTDAPAVRIADQFTNIEFLQAASVGMGLLLLAGLMTGTWIALNLMQQQGRLLLRLETLEQRLSAGHAQPYDAPAPQAAPPAGLPVGSKAPAFSLPRLLEGGTLSLDELLGRGLPTLLVFSDPNCGPCNQLMPALSTWQKELKDKATVAFVNRGERKANEEKAQALGLHNVLLQSGDEVADQYQLYGTPSAVLIGTDGHVQLASASGSAQIESLFKSASIDSRLTQLVALAPSPEEKASPLQMGDAAPEFALQSITGQKVQLSDKAGKNVLVLFWNPGCGFCAQMLESLKQWERERDEQSPELMLISTGSAQANRDMGLSSEVLLDQGFTVGTRFGAGGTPSAILVDAQGKIASGISVGASAVLALAHSRQTQLEPA